MESLSESITLEKTAKYLKIWESTVYEIARERQIPAVKIVKISRDFLLFSVKRPEVIENKFMKEYFYYAANQKKVSFFTLNIIINALLFYYGKVLKKDFIFEIKCFRKYRELPVVFS